MWMDECMYPSLKEVPMEQEPNQEPQKQNDDFDLFDALIQGAEDLEMQQAEEPCG